MGKEGLISKVTNGVYRALAVGTLYLGLNSCSDVVEPPIEPVPGTAPVCSFQASPTQGVSPLEVRIQGNCTDPDGDLSVFKVMYDGRTISTSNPLDTNVSLTSDASFTLEGSDSEENKTVRGPINIRVSQPPIPKPIINQTLSTVGQVNLQYDLEFENADSVIREIYHDGGLASTDTITNQNYSEVSNDALIGIHRVISKVGDVADTVEAEIGDIPSTPPQDIDQLKLDVKEGYSIIVHVPRAWDMNKQQRPVRNLSVKDRTGRTTPTIGAFPDDTVLTIHGNSPGNYQLELDFEGGTQPVSLEGLVIDLPRIQGRVENVRTRTGELARFVAFIVNGVDTTALKEGVTDNQGNYDIQLDDSYQNIWFSARLESGIPDSNYVRTLLLSGKDTTDLIVRAFPYTSVLSNAGVSREDFRLHNEETDSQYLKSHVRNLEMIDVDPYPAGSRGGLSYFFMNLIKTKVQNKNDLGCVLPFENLHVQIDSAGTPDSEKHYQVVPSGDGYKIIPDSLWVTKTRDTTLSGRDGATDRIDGYRYGIKLKIEDVRLAVHELLRVYLGLGDAVTLNDQQTAMRRIVTRTTPGPADCEKAYVNGEPTWPEFSSYKNILGLQDLPRVNP